MNRSLLSIALGMLGTTTGAAVLAAAPISAATRRGEIRGAIPCPSATAPASDSIPAATVPGTGLRVLLLLAIAGSAIALLVPRAPGTRRR